MPINSRKMTKKDLDEMFSEERIDEIIEDIKNNEEFMWSLKKLAEE